MHEALDAFVLFDEALVPALEAIDAVGATSFISYYLRNARASKQLAQTSPTSVALAAIGQHTTGISTLGNVNSSWLGGKFSPNTLQFDDLFNEANNVTLADIDENALQYAKKNFQVDTIKVDLNQSLPFPDTSVPKAELSAKFK